MKPKPIQSLIDILGTNALSSEIGVSMTTIYYWRNREAGIPDPSKIRRVGYEYIPILTALGKKHGVKGLTTEYLIGL